MEHKSFTRAACLALGLLATGSVTAHAATAAAAQADQTGVASAETPQSGGIEDIVVTAQRRSESAQDVPISIQAFSAETLAEAGVKKTEDLAAVVGGLIILPTGARPALYLRGVGSNSANTTPAILTFIDGIYMPFGQSSDLVNISSVEVLKGPQGTLFGRNATGGVLQITTTPPSETTRARFEIGYGNYEAVEASAYVTGKVADGVAVDLALRYRNQGDGYGTNVANGKDVFYLNREGARGRIKMDLSDTTFVMVGADYNKVGGTYGVNVSPAAGYETLFVAGAIRRRGEFYPGRYDVNANLQPFFVSKEWGVNMTMETELAGVTLRSLSSYRDSKEVANIDFDGGPANGVNLGIDRPRTAFTQELQAISSGSGPFKWVAGLFYYDSKWGSNPFQICPGGNLNTNVCNQAFSQDKIQSIAGYVQGTYEFTPSTRLTLGGRYTWESRKLTGRVNIAGVNRPERAGTLRLKIDEPTWRVALDHDLNDDVLVYGSVSRSFNSGFFNQGNFGGFANETQNPRVQPEFLTVYELGMKSDLLDRRLRVNLSGFFYKYNGLQQQIYELGVVRTINAGAAEIKGLEFEVIAKPDPSFTLSASGTYIDAKYTAYPLAPDYVPQPNGSITAAGSVDAKGNTIVTAPKFSATFSATHVLETGIGTLTSSVNLNYRGKSFIDPANRFPLPTRWLLNASQRLRINDGPAFVSIWADNLLNKRYDYATNILAPAGLVGNAAPPRTYGVTFGYDY